MIPLNQSLLLLPSHLELLMDLSEQVKRVMLFAGKINTHYQGKIGLLLLYNASRKEYKWNLGDFVGLLA